MLKKPLQQKSQAVRFLAESAPETIYRPTERAPQTHLLELWGTAVEKEGVRAEIKVLVKGTGEEKRKTERIREASASQYRELFRQSALCHLRNMRCASHSAANPSMTKP